MSDVYFCMPPPTWGQDLVPDRALLGHRFTNVET